MPQGIEYRNLGTNLQARVFGAVDRADRVTLSPGRKAMGLLRVASDVVDGETVTIGSNVFEVDIINTDSGVNSVDSALGILANSSATALLTLSAAPATARVAGDLVRIENEIMKVLRVVSTTEYVVARARCGTAAAAHAQNLDVYFSDAAPAANIPVGLVATLTPAVFTDALVVEINNALSGAERSTAKSSTIFDPGSTSTYAQRIGKVVASGPSDNEVLIVSAVPENSVLATTETLAGANNAWSAATMLEGAAPAIKNVSSGARVPTAVEVALGKLYIPVNFTPTWALVHVHTTSGGAFVLHAGAVGLAAGLLTLTNGTNPDWAETDSIYFICGD